jgi:hypothetical protein
MKLACLLLLFTKSLTASGQRMCWVSEDGDDGDTFPGKEQQGGDVHRLHRTKTFWDAGQKFECGTVFAATFCLVAS